VHFTWEKIIVFGQEGESLENARKTGFPKTEITKGFWPPRNIPKLSFALVFTVRCASSVTIAIGCVGEPGEIIDPADSRTGIANRSPNGLSGEQESIWPLGKLECRLIEDLPLRSDEHAGAFFGFANEPFCPPAQAGKGQSATPAPTGVQEDKGAWRQHVCELASCVYGNELVVVEIEEGPIRVRNRARASVTLKVSAHDPTATGPLMAPLHRRALSRPPALHEFPTLGRADSPSTRSTP